MSATTSAHSRPSILHQRCGVLKITSPVLEDNGLLSRQYTGDGANINPSLDIEGVPDGTASLALIMEDLDHPGFHCAHWVAWNIPVIGHLREARRMEAEGLSDKRVRGYRGPCPLSGTHRYRFNIYALDTLLDLSFNTTADGLRAAMEGHMLGWGYITGSYHRK